jgi:hypothetical protein
MNHSLRRTVIFFEILITLFWTVSCTTNRAEHSPIAYTPEPPTPPPGTRNGTITGWQGKSQGERLPAWLDMYIAGGIPSLESLPEFSDRYVFVAHADSGSLDALRYWLSSFDTTLDFPHLVFERIYARARSTLHLLPADEYGSWYETMLKAAASHTWTGAEADPACPSCWVERDKTDAEGASARQYTGYILLTVPRTVLDPQLTEFLNSIKLTEGLTRAQRQNIANLINILKTSL